jgi:hypothetical protein
MMLCGHLSLQAVQPIRLLLQSFLMNLRWISDGRENEENYEEHERTSFRYARNNFMPRGWFASLPGNTRVISAPLGIDEQDFLHLREELGEERMKKVLTAHGLLCGGKQPKAPCEPDWICCGSLRFGETFPGQPCICADWEIHKDVRRKACLVKGDWPLAGSFSCVHCLQKVFNKYEHKYLNQLKDNGVALNKEQKARLELRKLDMERHCRETEKSWKKKVDREGTDALQGLEHKLIRVQVKRTSDPAILEERAKAERQRADGKPKRSGGRKRRKKNGEYDTNTRKHLSTIALLCFKYFGQISIFQNQMIRLSDVLIRERWDELPASTKGLIVGLEEQMQNFPRFYLGKDIDLWIDFFTSKDNRASRMCYIRNSVQNISNRTVVILPDEMARTTAITVRSSCQAASSQIPFAELCDFLLSLMFDPSKELELKQTAKTLKWW